MSVDLFVLLSRDRCPSTVAWQQQIDNAGYPLQLDLNPDTTAHTGYWPAQLDGAPSGFEFYSGDATQVLGRPAPDSDHDFVAQFTTFSDLRELKASMLAAAAFAIVSGGVVMTEDDVFQPADEVASEALAL